MVCSDHGDRHRVNSPTQPPLQWDLALLHFGSCLLLERSSLHSLPLYLNCTVQCISRDMGSHDSPSHPEPFPWNVSNGSCHNCQHDCLRLCSSLGTWSRSIGMSQIPSFAVQQLTLSRHGLYGGLMLLSPLHAACTCRSQCESLHCEIPALYLTGNSMYVHEHQLSSMTATWLLPVVATIVAAASGGIVAEVLPNPQHALWTLIISYILWGTGVPLAMAILVIYFQRLTIHNLPPREVIVSVFLPIGPLGQGGFGIMQLGKVAIEIFPKAGTLRSSVTNSGDILYVMGWLTATIMWGFGLVWLFFAGASITRSKFPFNMGWWGFTFPLGVFATSTTQMAKELPSEFFNVLGTVCETCAISFHTLLWYLIES